MKNKIKTKILIMMILIIQMIQISVQLPVNATIKENDEVTLLRRT